MAGSKNYFATQSKEQLSEWGKIGGKKSGEAKRKKKLMKETLSILVNMPLEDKKCVNVEKIKSFKGLKGKNITVEDAMLVAQVQRALMGDINAITFIRDTLGERPKDKVDFEGQLPVVITGEDMLED